jgi:hypothetical protein
VFFWSRSRTFYSPIVKSKPRIVRRFSADAVLAFSSSPTVSVSVALKVALKANPKFLLRHRWGKKLQLLEISFFDGFLSAQRCRRGIWKD